MLGRGGSGTGTRTGSGRGVPAAARRVGGVQKPPHACVKFSLTS
jgi:hypothetical protein